MSQDILNRALHLPGQGGAGELLRVREAGSPEAMRHSLMGLGLGVLFREMADQGVEVQALLRGTDIPAAALEDPNAQISHRDKVQIFRNVKRLSSDPAIFLMAGRHQRVVDYGLYGYALASCSTLASAVEFGIHHVKIAGPILEKSFRIVGSVAIFEGHDIISVGEMLPSVTEFWFSSVQAMISHIMEQPFRFTRVRLPYAAPAYAEQYRRVFECPVEFDYATLVGEFDASLLSRVLPNACPATERVCRNLCASMLEPLLGDEPELVGYIRQSCISQINATSCLPSVEAMARQQCMSVRTLVRRLAELGTTYQRIVNDVRRSLAEEYLRNTSMSIDDIAECIGFSDASNFRKSFQKWSGESPSEYRGRAGEAAQPR
ncbi:HTH-type transcriptional regulator VirS [mine drainage metagenome]|uniref:HTH-type transcriptional regulator VirS n=1 Tax=mine drainage metagenome TaxID=410659 RepID=A0A1J5QWQ2_9ZZZZ